MLTALLVVVVVLGVALLVQFVRDTLAAADQRADVPAVFVAATQDPGHATESAQRSEHTPRDIRDPSPIEVGPFVPAHLFIPEAGVNTSVLPEPATMEYNPFFGNEVLTFPVPDDAFTTVWWNEGPHPGDDGLAVILGHARTPRPAVFNDLPDLTEGAVLGLTGQTRDGQEVAARYRVEQVVTGISKTDAAALRSVLDNPPPGATLALITCSGDLDEVLSSRVDNTVVFASSAGAFSNG